MEIINATRWQMTNPECFRHGGDIVVQGVTVFPGNKEMMVMRKRYATPTGSYGTMSYDIRNKQVIVMWSCPFNFNFYDNRLAIGITAEKTHSTDTFSEMHSEAKDYFVTLSGKSTINISKTSPRKMK